MQKKKKDEKTPTQNGKESLSLVEDNEVTLKNLTDQILQLEQRWNTIMTHQQTNTEI